MNLPNGLIIQWIRSVTVEFDDPPQIHQTIWYKSKEKPFNIDFNDDAISAMCVTSFSATYSTTKSYLYEYHSHRNVWFALINKNDFPGSTNLYSIGIIVIGY